MSGSIYNISRRTLLGGAGATIAAVALASSIRPARAAGGFAQPDGQVPDQYKGRQRVVMWSTFSDSKGQALDKLVKQFNASQNDIYVDNQFQGTYIDNQRKLTASIQARQVPDIVGLTIAGAGSWSAMYVDDALAPLDGYYDQNFPLTSYLKQFLEYGQIKGSTYWIPFAPSNPLFYYNKTLFQKAGLPDRAPKTWSELAEWTKQFKGITYKGIPTKLYGYSGQDTDWQFMAMLWQFGGSSANGFEPTMDSPVAIEVGEFTRKLVYDAKQAYMAAPGAIVSDFQNGVCAAATMSTASLAGLVNLVDFDLGAAFMPSEKESAVPAGGGGWSIPAGVPAERQAAAMTFIKWLGQPAQAAAWAIDTGYIPATYEGAKYKAYVDLVAKDDRFALAGKQLERVRKYPLARQWVPNFDVTIFNSLQKVWTADAKPKDEFPVLNKNLQQMSKDFQDQYKDMVL